MRAPAYPAEQSVQPGAGLGEEEGGLPAGGRGGGGWVAGVGQPLRPPPDSPGRWRVGHQDPEVVGRVEGGELADDGSGEGAGADRWTGEGQDPDLAKRDRDRCAGEPGGAANQLLGRQEQLGVVLGEGVEMGVEAGRDAAGDRAAADPDAEDVGVRFDLPSERG